MALNYKKLEKKGLDTKQVVKVYNMYNDVLMHVTWLMRNIEAGNIDQEDLKMMKKFSMKLKKN